MDRVYQRILAQLLDEIVAGRIPPGSALPATEQIAARYACSRGAAREAVRALEERRVVEVRPGTGQHVLYPDRWRVLDADVAAAMLLRHRDKRLLAEAVTFMRLIETQAARLAAGRVSDGDVAFLEQLLELMRRAARGENGASTRDQRFAIAEADFHRTLMMLTGNPFLAGSLEDLHAVLARVRRAQAADRDPLVIVLHERIVAALRERDAIAAAAAADDYARHLASWLRV